MTNNPQNLPNGSSRRKPRRIEFLVYEEVNLLDVAGPLQVVTSCNELLRERGESAAYEAHVVALKGETIRTSSGLGIAALSLPDHRKALDTLIVCGGFGVHKATAEAELITWLERRTRAAQRVASVCTGAFLLAEIGLLDGKRAVTHWAYCDRLAREFPAICVEPDPIFVEDGDVWTSAGISSGIDLMLALVERDRGREMALAVARRLVVYLKRPGGQAQFSTALELQDGADRFDHLHAWMKENLDSDLSVTALALRAGMSERSFNRRYKSATGSTPARAVDRIRVETAQRNLCNGSLSVKEIARRCGFGSEETMRRTFLRHVGTAPGEFRKRFGT